MKSCLLMLLCFFTTLFATAQITNADFESWHLDSTGSNRLVGWQHLTKTDAPAIGNLFGTWQDTYSQHGTYALTVSRWYNYSWDNVQQKAPLSTRPTALTGYYKYTKTPLTGLKTDDTAAIDLYLTLWNISSHKEDTIGTGRQKLAASNSYQPFTCAINYTGTLTPDSILIHIEPSIYLGIAANCADSNYCSFLTVDDFSLVNKTGVNNLTPANTISIFPNPAKDNFNIYSSEKIGEVVITNTLGQTIFTQSYTNTYRLAINTRYWLPGLYFVKLNNNYVQKLLKQ